MPTYQYRCTQCGDDLEAVQKFTDPALTECPACRGALRKVFNAVGVVFKGSGFYRTDSRAAGNGSARDSDSSDKSDKTDKKSESSGDRTDQKSDKSDKPAEKVAAKGSTNGSSDQAKQTAGAGSGSRAGSSTASGS